MFPRFDDDSDVQYPLRTLRHVVNSIPSVIMSATTLSGPNRFTDSDVADLARKLESDPEFLAVCTVFAEKCLAMFPETRNEASISE